jgi:hypothetical protein
MPESRLRDRRRGLSLLLVLPVLGLLATGCGNSTAIGSLSVTKEEFIRQADLICGEADQTQPREYNAFAAKHKTRLEQLGKVGSEATISRDLKLPSARQQIRDIEALQVPPGEEKRIGAIIARWNAVVKKGEKNPYLFGLWWNKRDPFTEIKRDVIRYGFWDCQDLR